MSANSESKSEAKRERLVVVLGGCGFMGSHVCRALVAGGERVRVFDKVYAGRKLIRDIEPEVEMVEGDIARTDDVLSALEGAETLIHLVHTTVPGSSMNDPAYDVESNVVSSARWLPRLGETGVRRIVFVSSGGTVYGPPRSVPIGESHPTDPISSYGITKLMIEKYVAMYASMCGVAHVIVRPSNVYGEGQRLHIGQGVIGVLADRALRGEPLEVWGTGESLRDYLYVGDFVDAVTRLVNYVGPHRVFNISSGRGHSVRDIIGTLERALGHAPEVTHKPARGFDVPANVLDSSLLRAETGWEPRVSLEDGVARVVAWLRREAGA
ncbi:MAG TPA: NAD-dependent epimerase/dehydratase family protein [Pyrinomonadaceae bacterium]|nr:NAD-dependent epimerase/dehydratase family protein [Pyrinomonadaceae bacterium]